MACAMPHLQTHVIKALLLLVYKKQHNNVIPKRRVQLRLQQKFTLHAHPMKKLMLLR